MSKKTKATIAITLAIAVMVLIFISSSMPYKDQSLVSTIQKGLPMQPFSELLSKIKFEYAGQTISIPSLGYAQFIEFFIRKAAHFLAYFFIGYQWTRGLSVHVRKNSRTHTADSRCLCGCRWCRSRCRTRNLEKN